MDSELDRDGAAVIKHRNLLWYGLMLVPLLFLAVFFFYPLGSILHVSLWSEAQIDLTGFVTVIASSYYRQTLWFTIWQAVLSTVLTLGLALPAAFVFTRFEFPGRSVLLSLSTLAFVLPTVVVAAAFSALIGPRGVVNALLTDLFALEQAPIQLERTLAIILIAHVFYNFAVALRIITGYWSNQSTRIEEAALILGARGWRLWWEVRLPLLRPAILSAGVLVFIFTFTSFGVILLLGGPRYATLEVEIYRQATSLFNLPMAAALSLVQIGFMFVMLVIYTRLQRQVPVDLQRAHVITRRPTGAREWLLVGGAVVAIGVLIFTPLLALVLRSLAGSAGVTLANYAALGTSARDSILFVAPLQAVTNSLVFALITTLFAVVLGVASALVLGRESGSATRWLDPVFMLPLATSAVTLGFGFIIALDEPPLNLRTSPLLIPIAHTLVAMPFVVRSVLPALRAIAPAIRESASVLGASPWQVWRWVDIPLMSRGLLVGATFAFTVSLGEFGASVFIARPDTPTMPVVIYRLLGQPGITNYGQALAMSSLLLLVCGCSFLVIERMRTAGIGEF
jgi:thiamine transport system permease protein